MMIEQIRNLFIQEVTRQIDTIEKELNSTVIVEFDKNLVEKVFHTMHNIKGSGPMVGFHFLPIVAMPAEKTFDRIRKGELPFSPEVKDKTNDLLKLMREILANNCDKSLSEGENQTELVNFFKQLV